jgi:hypothetical protein
MVPLFPEKNIIFNSALNRNGIFFQGTKEPFLFKAELRMIFFLGNKGTIPV